MIIYKSLQSSLDDIFFFGRDKFEFGRIYLFRQPLATKLAELVETRQGFKKLGRKEKKQTQI